MLPVLKVFEKLNIKDEHLILSVSGGVDSMSLLSYLNNNTNYKLVVVHFNHLTRKENIDEEQLVKEYCLSNKIPFYSFKIKVESGNFQSKARHQRLSLLKEIANNYKTPYIVTAHHLDDLIETMLMRMYRGSHILSLFGFEEVSYEGDFIFVKPFLLIDKKTIIKYAKASNTNYLNDPTNLENIYLRNKIRNNVIPKLENEDKNFKQLMLSNYYLLLKLKNDIRTKTLSFLNNDTNICLNKFDLLDNLVKEDIVTYLLNKFNVGSSSNKLHKVFRAISNKKPNLSIPITKNIVFIKSYNLAFFSDLKNLKFHTKQLILDQIVVINDDFSILYTKKEPKNTNNWSVLWYNDLVMPLTVRLRKNGDKLVFHYGTKKLKDFFIDEKVPRLKRDSSLIVTDANDQILWIPFLYLNQTLGKQNKLFLKIIENNQEEDNHEQKTR